MLYDMPWHDIMTKDGRTYTLALQGDKEDRVDTDLQKLLAKLGLSLIHMER